MIHVLFKLCKATIMDGFLSLNHHFMSFASSVIVYFLFSGFNISVWNCGFYGQFVQLLDIRNHLPNDVSFSF